MKILFLTNLYPPAGSGGYEQWCQEVAEGLRSNGHKVRVLTSRKAGSKHRFADPDWVSRDLNMEMEFGSLAHSLHFFTRRNAAEQENLDYLHQVVSDFQPDILLVWGMWNLHRSLASCAESLLPGRVVYYMGDYWPTLPNQHTLYWQAPAKSWAAWAPKALLRPFAEKLLSRSKPPRLKFEHVLFPSEFLRDEYQRLGVRVATSRIVFGAIDTSPYLRSNGGQIRKKTGGPLALLYAGRLAEEKGVETAIEGVASLVRQGVGDIHLTIVGRGLAVYEAFLKELVRQEQLESYITFAGPVSKAEMPDLYRQFDVFLFTSKWQEPFGRVIVEALASGVAVVGTATGGAAEILNDGETGLTFPPGDGAALAAAVLRLLHEPGLREKLVVNGQQVAKLRFDMARMVAEIEAYLLELAG